MDNEIDKELSLLKLGDIGWVFTDDQLNVKDENYEMALNLSLNKISGEWDDEKLAVVLEDLEVNGFDVELTGFDSEEVKKMTFVEDKDEFDELAGFNDYDEKYGDNEEDDKEGNEKVYFKLVLMLSSEKEQEELYLQLQEGGYDCQILTY